VIRLEAIEKTYELCGVETHVLRGISLHIEKGEMVAIMGPSGSGKSTLLNILGLIDRPTNGRYWINGIDALSITRHEAAHMRNGVLGFVLQDFALVEDWTVCRNIELPLRYAGKRKAGQKRIEELLYMLGLENLRDYPVRFLSGGQKQRTAIARALVNDPEVILADEPTGALDKKNGEAVMQLLKEANSQGKTVVVVTHDSDIASFCDRKLVLVDGKFVQRG
jgi:putative ABC transport system ATP-binding protein